MRCPHKRWVYSPNPLWSHPWLSQKCHGDQEKFPRTVRNQMLLLPSRQTRRKILGTAGQSFSAHSMQGQWSKSSWKLLPSILGTRRGLAVGSEDLWRGSHAWPVDNDMSGSAVEGRVADVVYFDFYKVSSAAFHNIIIDKLMKYRLDKWAVRWAEHWVSCQAERAVISGMKSIWRPATSCVPQGLYRDQYFILSSLMTRMMD